MTRIALVADSGCDLPPEIIDRYHIHIVPLVILFEEDQQLDSYENRERFWQRVAAGEIPRSASPGPGAFEAAFRQALQEADEVIAMILTSKHSGTFNSARLAAQAFPGQVHVFDSWAISLGSGLLALHAAQLIEQGADAATILSSLTDARQRLRIYLYLHTLEAVQRGGRVALAMTVIKRMSAMLSVKVILTMQQGELKVAGVVRSPSKGMDFIVQQLQGKQAQSVAIAHTRWPQKAAQLAERVAAALSWPQDAILYNEAGPALGVHGGAGAFGVAFIEKQSNLI